MKEILERLERGELTARQALRLLITAGLVPGFAQESIFITLGGSDVIETGDDGRERYVPSGKLVREVEAAMRR